MSEFYDLLPLPSKGIFYDTPLEILKINYITTFDQLQLTSPNLINQNNVIDYILTEKVNNFNIDDLLVQDKNAILLYLREIALGNKVYYKLDGEEITIDLNDIPYNTINILPIDGSYIYPLNEYQIKFSPITYKQEKQILEAAKSLKLTSNSLYLTFLIDDILLNGSSILLGNKFNNITEFFKKIKYPDYTRFKKFIKKVLNFGYDLDYNYTDDDNQLEINVKIDSYFFHCSIENYEEYKTLLFSEINSLVTDGKYDYTSILAMPTHHRRGNINALIKNFTEKEEAQQKEINKSKR